MKVIPHKIQLGLGKVFRYDFVYATFWLSIATILFFLPVAIGRQSFTEAVPTFYSTPSPNPSIKTPWQIDGGWHTVDVIPLVKSEIGMTKEGMAPLWAPYSGGGEPQITSNAVSVFYPLRLAFFSLWDSTRAFDWYFILRFLISGLGMFYFLRTISLGRTVAIWGAIAYSFTGYFILYISYAFLDIDSLLPWLLLAVEKYLKRSTLTAAVPVGILLAMGILVGQPQSTIISFIFILFYFGWRTLQEVKNKEGRWRSMRHIVFAIFLAFLIALPFITDFLVNYSQGKAIDAWQNKGLNHFPPTYLLHFIAPPSMMPEVAASGHLFDRFYLIIPYVGLSVFLLLALSFFLKKKPSQLYPFYAWIGFVVLKNVGFPLVHWIGKLPIFSQIGWYKAYGPMAAAIVIGGAIAFEKLLSEKEGEAEINRRGFYKLLAGIPLLFAGAYIFFKESFLRAYVPNFDFANRQPEMIEKVLGVMKSWPQKIQDFVLSAIQDKAEYFTLGLFLEVVFFGAISLLLIYFIGKKRRWPIIGIIFLTAFELWFYMPKIRDGFQYLDPYAQTPPYVSFLQQKMGEEGVARTFSVGNVFMGHLGEMYKLQKSQNNSSIKPERYLTFLPEEVTNNDQLSATISSSSLLKIPKKFFDAFNIRYLLSEEKIENMPNLKMIYDRDLKVYENETALPKAYIVFEKETADSITEAREKFYDENFDPRSAVTVEGMGTLNDIVPPSDNKSFVAAKVLSYKPQEVLVESETEKDGVLVLSENFYPGWKAYIDGKRTEIYPANVLFRGVDLPKGAHKIRFVYEPRWFWPSLIISLSTLMILIAVVIFQKRWLALRNRKEINAQF